MNLEMLRQKLMRAGRRHPPSTRVPLAFEQRILALVRALPSDPLRDWGTGLWRAAICSIGVALFAGVWLGRPLVGTEGSLADAADTEVIEAALIEMPEADLGSSW